MWSLCQLQAENDEHEKNRQKPPPKQHDDDVNYVNFFTESADTCSYESRCYEFICKQSPKGREGGNLRAPNTLTRGLLLLEAKCRLGLGTH